MRWGSGGYARTGAADRGVPPNPRWSTGIRATPGASRAVAPAARARAQRPRGSRADRAPRRAAEPGVVPPGSTARGRARAARVAARPTDGTATTPSISPGAGSSSKPPAVRCIPGCRSPLSHRRATPWQGRPASEAAGLVLVHREQRAVTDRRSAARVDVGGSGRRRVRRESSEAAASQRSPGHEEARDRHQREPHQACRRVRRAALRRRDHAVRSGQGGVPGVPVAPGASCTGASRIPRSRGRTIGPPCPRSSAWRPSSRRGSVPAPSAGGTIDQEVNPCRTDETVNVRYMVDDVDEAIAFYTEHLGFDVLTSASPAFADVKRGNLRLLLSGPASSAGRPMTDGTRPGPGG